MKKDFLLIVICCLLGMAGASFAATYTVSSIAELKDQITDVSPGDRVVLADGVYTNDSDFIHVRCAGTEAEPITIEAETIGGVELGGEYPFKVREDAAHVIIKGFHITTLRGVSVDAGASNCHITRNIFQCSGWESDDLGADGPIDLEISYNEFLQYEDRPGGQMINIVISSNPDYGDAERPWIHHNYFHDQPADLGNGHEAIKLGREQVGVTNAVVEYNLFKNVLGEPETISNKSTHNTYRYNTLDNTRTLTIRGGTDCNIYGNFFINGGCARVYGARHKIYSNYFQGGNSHLEIGCGKTVTGVVYYAKAEDCIVAFNTFRGGSPYRFSLHDEGNTGADNITFANNLMVNANYLAQIEDLSLYSNATWEGNIAWNFADMGGITQDIFDIGFTNMNPNLQLIDGVYRIQAGSPAENAAAGSYPFVTIDMDAQLRSGLLDVGADEVSSAPILNRPLTEADVGPYANLSTTLLEDDFEAGLNEWTVTDTVTTNTAAQSPVNSGGIDVQGARLVDDETTTSRIEQSFSVSPGSTLYIQFDYRHKPGVINPAFQLRNGGQPGINMNLMSWNDNLLYHNGSGWTAVGTALETDEWYRFTITVQPAETADDQFDLHIHKLAAGEPFEVTHTGLGFQNDLTAFDEIRFQFNAYAETVGGEFHIDNVLVTTSPDDLNYVAFSDLPIQDGLLMHLDASRLSGIDEGDSIEQWPNLAAPGTYATAENSGSSPTYHTNGINSQPVVRFDGTDDWMDAGDLRTNAGPIEVFIVTESSDTGDGNWQNLISSFTGGPNNHTAPNWALLRPNDSGTPLPVAPSILTKSSSSGLSLGGLSLARRGSDQSAYYGGDMAEVIIYGRNLEAWERNELEYHLAHKFGLDIENYLDISVDTDRDGFSDYDELIAGTLINDSNDYFSAGFNVSAGTVQLQWDSVTEREYSIQRSFDLIYWEGIATFTGDHLEKLFEESVGQSNAVFYKMEITHH